MDALLIVLAVFFTLVLLGLNVYLLILYCHTDDKGLGTAWYCKVLIVLGLTLCQAQALMVPLDVANQSALFKTTGVKLDMASFWFFIYIIILFFVVVLLPFALFMYETDEDDTMCKRISSALCYTIAAIAAASMILFISWAYLKEVDVPYKAVTLKFTDGIASTTPTSAITVPTFSKTDSSFTLTTSLAVYIIALLSFFGWILVVVFGGVGICALPFDLFREFRQRPRAKRSQEMRRNKDFLTKTVTALTKEGEQLKKEDQERTRAALQEGFFSRWTKKRAFETKLTEYRAKFSEIETQYQKFQLELELADTNPIVPYLKLVAGVLFVVTGILWLIQIVLGCIARSYITARPLTPFMSQMLTGLQQRNAGFIATALFAYFCLYILWSVQKGNLKFGLRLPCCCHFHPMKPDQTWMNSFLFNVILMLIGSVGVIQLCCSAFPSYVRNTEVYMLFGVQANYMRFYSFFYERKVFHIAFVIWASLSLIYEIFALFRKVDPLVQLRKRKAKAKARSDQ